MPFERSNPSEITGENEVFSWTRSISLATCRRPFWITASVTGSSVMSHLPKSPVVGPDPLPNHQIPQAVDDNGCAGVDDNRRIGLLDNRRTGERRPSPEGSPVEDRGLEPAAIEVYLPPAACCGCAGPADGGSENHQIHGGASPDNGGAHIH